MQIGLYEHILDMGKLTQQVSVCLTLSLIAVGRFSDTENRSGPELTVVVSREMS